MGFPRGVAVHYSTGGEVAALPIGRTRGFKPRVRYNLIHRGGAEDAEGGIFCLSGDDDK